ncbi:MAG TPA: hypothetical protein VH598_01505 [Verrucomicrobiae bacterium]|nr:hypothetical protein [Verrucomicrobiae bacterium]
MKKDQALFSSLCNKLRLGPIFLVIMTSVGIIGWLIVAQGRDNQGASRGALKAISGVNREMSTLYQSARTQAGNAGMKLPDAPNFDPTGKSNR